MLSHDSNFVFVFVLFGPHFEWSKIIVRSIRKYFNNTIIVVDHNEIKSELDWLNSQDNIVILNNQFGKNYNMHGGGLDVATRWCVDNSIKIMILVEPDCVLTGVNDVNTMIAEINNGMYMVGSNRMSIGCIHPAPSAWLVSKIPGTFASVVRDMVIDPSLVSLHAISKMIVDYKMNEDHARFWLYMWDTGLYNWYRLALINKTKLIPATDLHHFWCSSSRGPHDIADKSLIFEFMDD